MGFRRQRDRDAEERARELRQAARRGAQGDAVEQARALAFLRSLTPPELAQFLRRVFADNPPSAGQVPCDRSVLFLGIARSSWAHTPEPGEPPEWGEWKTGAVAYQDSEANASSLGAALHREARCPECRTHLWSNSKVMVCAVCGWA
ncbi:hypothetical protein [Gemmata sp.]|uniref:hypothetical protein n=1 Tax=Gemmata sp. TaxID=1914242 RepID=UPI003F72F236